MTPEQSDPAMRTEGLTEMALFEGCQADQLVPLAGRLSPLLAEPGQVLMRQGEDAVFFILIQTGRAEVTHTDDDGSVAVLGDTFARTDSHSCCTSACLTADSWPCTRATTRAV